MVNTADHRHGNFHEIISPVTGNAIDRVALATKAEVMRVLAELSRQPFSASIESVLAFLDRLRGRIELQRELFFERTWLETGFIARDSMEIVDGAIEFLSDFDVYARAVLSNEGNKPIIRHAYSGNSARDMRIVHRPLRCIAAVIPQNAFLSLGIITIASALYAGSRVILRPSLQSGSSGSLLAEAVMESDPLPASVVIVNSQAGEFLEACCATDDVDLVHYIGSNQYAASVLMQTFSTGKSCLLDGQGNGMLYLDDGFPLEEAVSIIGSGATRFNGETCTSVNGVLVKETVYEQLKEALVDAFRNLQVGHPLAQGIQVGPLFSAKQALGLSKTLQETSHARILCGGEVKEACFSPAVVEGVSPADPMVREGFFGPALWIQRVREDTVWNWLQANRFPLSDTILSTNPDLIHCFASRSRAARIAVNADPSVESMFEPWGGYPPGGLNPVSTWIDKYRQALLVDGRLKDIMRIPADVRTGNR